MFKRFLLPACLSLLVSWPALAASVDQSLYTVRRTSPLSESSLRRDYYQAQNLFQNVTLRLKQSQERWRDAPLGRAEIDQIIAQLALVNTEFLLKNQDLQAASRDLDIALEHLRKAQLALMDSRPVEMRGLLLDAGSLPRTRAALAQLLDELQTAGFNTLFPEVFRRGFAIYPDSQFTDQDPELKGLGFDPLWELIREAQKRQLRVIPWVWTFRVRSPGFGNPILSRLPALAAMPGDIEDQKSVPRFLSPAHPEAREYVLQLFQELLTRYPVQGLLLDYIRYDELIPEDALSITRFRQEYFRQHKTYPPLKIAKGSELFPAWQLWREEQVNRAVRAFREKLRLSQPGSLLLGGSVFRSESYSRLTKMQNWRHWADNNWIDFSAGMLYTDDPKDLELWLDWETDGGKRQDLLYPVLGAHRFSHPDNLFGQIGTLRELQTGGFSIFALAHFKRESLLPLKQGPFRKPARLPHEDFAQNLNVLFADMEHWLVRVAQTPGAPAGVAQIRTDLQKLRQSCQKLSSNSPASAWLNPLQALLDSLNDRDLPAPFKQELQARLGYPHKLLLIRQRQETSARAYTPPTAPSVVVLPGARPLPAARVPKTFTPPILDGQLDRDEWEQATELKIKYWYNGFAESGINTSVFVSHDQDFLYLGFDNEEPNPERVSAAITEWDDKRLFNSDDAIEIMLAPSSSKQKYFHFALNSKNTRYDARQSDSSWNGGWKSAVHVQGERWQAELAIPLRELGLDPRTGLQLSANFFRNRFQELTPYAAWSVPFESYHTPARFGTLTLD